MNEVAEISFNIPELTTIEPSRADQIKATFEPMAVMLKEFEKAYNTVVAESKKEITDSVMTKARKLRLKIAKVRIQTEKVRKKEKEEYLRAGKAIDGVANILKWAVIDKEKHLKEIENYFEIMEQKRLEALQAKRAEMLAPYVEDASERNLASMDEDVWNAYFRAKKKEYEDRLEAERKAEEERIAREKAEAEERERIRKENERLKAEREKKEAELRKAQEEAERIRKEKEKLEAEKKAREKAEAEAKARAEQVARDKKHRNKVEQEAVDALVGIIGEIAAKAVVRLIAEGKVPNIKIVY